MNKVIPRRQPDQRSRIPHYAFRRGGVQLFSIAVQRRVCEPAGACARRISSTALLGVNRLISCIASSPRAGRSVLSVPSRPTYDAQDGSKRYVTEVVCDECEFVDLQAPGRRLSELWRKRRLQCARSCTPILCTRQ